jgi:hypothetical protein
LCIRDKYTGQESINVPKKHEVLGLHRLEKTQGTLQWWGKDQSTAERGTVTTAGNTAE